jgi:hypothetical protein
MGFYSSKESRSRKRIDAALWAFVPHPRLRGPASVKAAGTKAGAEVHEAQRSAGPAYLSSQLPNLAVMPVYSAESFFFTPTCALLL